MNDEYIKKETFVFTYLKENKEHVVENDIPLPLTEHIREYGFRIMSINDIPAYLEDEFFDKFENFIKTNNEKLLKERDDAILQRFLDDPSQIKTLVNKWCQSIRKSHAAYANQELDEADREEEAKSQFAAKFQELIDSPALDTIIQLEHSYASSVGELVAQRDASLAGLQITHETTMEDAIKKLGSQYTEQDINYLSYKNFEEQERLTSEWNIKIKNLKKLQRNEFQEWVIRVYDDYKKGCGSPGYFESSRGRTFSDLGLVEVEEEEEEPNIIQSEESFTIQLGSQLKTMSNIRVLVADVFDLCKYRERKTRGGGLEVGKKAQRLQTAISLYSNNLSGLVILVDNRVNSYRGIKHEFAKVAGSSSELHFKDHEEQLEAIRQKLNQSHTGTSQSPNSDSQQLPFNQLQPGDFYITHHSNLRDYHVVFHLVVDDSVKVSNSPLKSGHPILLGIRNIIRVAYEKDINTLTIPLLLTHEMTEEMTIPWCKKRAEQMFLCVKGAMIEMATVMGSPTKTIQFLLPKDISSDLFHLLCGLVPNIFRLSNPLVLTTSK